MAPNPHYVHTDLFVYLSAFPHVSDGCITSKELVEVAFTRMLSDLTEISGGILVVPTYNYGFTKTGLFDARTDVSEVGNFSEEFRKKFLKTRTYIPVFSNCSNKEGVLEKKCMDLIDPFGVGSDFEKLVKSRGFLTTFGSVFSPTFIHYIERQIEGGPLYRYDKVFPGTVIDMVGRKHTVKLLYHVRPLNSVVKYDVGKIENELAHEGILKHHKLNDSFKYSICDLYDFLSYAIRKIEKDPLYFLTAESKNYFSCTNELFNGRVNLKDYE